MKNDYAFPTADSTLTNGLSKREYMATRIMASLAVGYRISDSGSKAAEVAVVWADALIRELSKKE
jgi:hypothetical protein